MLTFIFIGAVKVFIFFNALTHCDNFLTHCVNFLTH